MCLQYYLVTDMYYKGSFGKTWNLNSVQSVWYVCLYELRTSGLLECTLQDRGNFISEVSFSLLKISVSNTPIGFN